LKKSPICRYGLRIWQRYAKSKLMPTDLPTGPASPDQPAPPNNDQAAEKRPLPPAAERALAEAAARRAARGDNTAAHSKELNGPGGPEPTRYGDWEINGIASDF
jgi:hypothetical protein